MDPVDPDADADPEHWSHALLGTQIYITYLYLDRQGPETIDK